MIEPTRPALAMLNRRSGAAFPVELGDAALSIAGLLEDNPLASAPLKVAEEGSSGNVSTGALSLRRSYLRWRCFLQCQ